jgi:hypothetical protein
MSNVVRSPLKVVEWVKKYRPDLTRYLDTGVIGVHERGDHDLVTVDVQGSDGSYYTHVSFKVTEDNVEVIDEKFDEEYYSPSRVSRPSGPDANPLIGKLLIKAAQRLWKALWR